MQYIDLERLVDEMLQNIFEGQDLNSLTDCEKSRMVYKYLTEHIKFDYYLWEMKKAKNMSLIPDQTKQVFDIFIYNKGYCSAIAQAYKLLLENLNIPVVAVLCYDDGDGHQNNLVKRNGNWSFDDVTLGIIFPEKRKEYFDYDDPASKKQEIIAVLPEEICDFIYGRPSQEKNYDLEKNEIGYYKLPSNLKSSKSEQTISGKTR